MTMTTAAADTAAVPEDETSRRARKPKPKTTPAGVDAALVSQLVAQAREQGLQLSGDGGLLQQLTKLVLASARLCLPSASRLRAFSSAACASR